MSVLTLEAKLERADPNTSWGFRMQGGKDFSSLLTILRVTPGSLAAKCGLQPGDIILKIGSVAADTLKHKDAQDKIITSGNRLDLLLQRIREKKISGGGTANKPVTEKFSSPSFTPSLQPNQATTNSQQNYNALPRPFTSASQQPQQQAANLQYGSGIDGVTQQAQNLSMGSGAPAAYQPLTQKYNEGDDQPNPAQHQSRSFKLLKGMMDTGQGQPQQPSPPWIRKSLADEEKPSEKDVDEHDRKIYFPSETYALVHEQDLSKDQKLGTVAPKSQQQQLQGSHSRTFKLLQQKLDGAPSQHQAPPPPPPPPPPAPAPPAPRPPPVQTAPAWKPTSPRPPVPKPATTQVQPPWVQQVPRPASESATRPSASGAVRGKKGDAVFNRESSTSRIPVCASCGTPIRGPFVMAMGKTWCPDHFVCANPSCGVKLIDIGFVEEGGRLYCEKDYEQHFAPHCSKCRAPIVGECVNALQQQWHPVCFLCEHCKQPIGGGSFHIEDGKPFCDKDWAAMYQTMCFGCQFPIEPGDRWVEAMDHSWHSGCFNCTTCQASLEGQPFYAKSGKPYCKRHAR